MKPLTFASSSRGRAAVARRAHNPKVSGSIPDLATPMDAQTLIINRLGVFLLDTSSSFLIS